MRQLLSDIEKLGCGCHTRAPKPISVSCVCRGAEARNLLFYSFYSFVPVNSCRSSVCLGASGRHFGFFFFFLFFFFCLNSPDPSHPKMNFGVCVPVNKVLEHFFSIINLRCMNFFFFDLVPDSSHALVVNCSSILVVRLAHSADLRSRQSVLVHQLLFTFLLLSVLIHFHKQLCSFMFEILSPRAKL